MAATYEGVVKRLIRAFKFECVRAAYKPLAAAMFEALPYLGPDIVVVPVPTARQRGYDQAKLLAQEIARCGDWRFQISLRRRHDFRQVGSSRAQRFSQAANAFEYAGGDLAGRHILLVDDVTTSGATLGAAAALLTTAGAERVDAVVAAKHTLE